MSMTTIIKLMCVRDYTRSWTFHFMTNRCYKLRDFCKSFFVQVLIISGKNICVDFGHTAAEFCSEYTFLNIGIK